MGQISISGGIGYDNLIMMDGVDSGMFIFGNSSGPTLFPTEAGLFIEDAIEETQVLTGTISAEYGRFTGGVVNAITKGGGNQFKGTVRMDMTNPAWREESPIEDELGIENESQRNDLFSATLGGYILKDKLWFFLAGSETSRSDPSIFPVSNEPQPNDFDNQRYEIKLTGNIGGRHTLEGLTLQNNSDLVFSLFGIDPRTIDEASLEHEYVAFRYTGVLGSKLLLEARYSDRSFLNSGFGGSSTDIRDSPFYDANFTYFYNAPIFDEADQSFDFNDEIFAGILSYFLSSGSAGSHDLRFGLESITMTQRGGNSQSSTGFLMYADYLKNQAGSPVLDERADSNRSSHLAWPRHTPSSPTVVRSWISQPTRSLPMTSGDSTITGASMSGFDMSRSRATPRPGRKWQTSTRSCRDWPRPTVLVPAAGTASQPATTNMWGEPTRSFSRRQYFAQRFRDLVLLQWSVRGRIDFEPGFDLDNYIPYFGLFPGANAFFEQGLSVPKSVEISLSGAMQLPGGGFVEAALINRSFEDAFESFIEIDNGMTTLDTPAGSLVLDNVIYRNTDLSKRDYLALQVQGRHRFRSNWTLDGHWTWEIENDGNFVGEQFGNPAVQSPIGTYPEILVADRNFPLGHSRAISNTSFGSGPTTGCDSARRVIWI